MNASLRIGAYAALVSLGLSATPAAGGAPPGALSLATAALAKIDDYRTTIQVHETDGRRVEDRTYRLMFKKPALERIDVTAGPGKGGGIVWLGGDKVKGHRGGLLSGIRLTFDLHNAQVESLRGDSVDTGTMPAILAEFATVKGQLTQTPGPQIDGADSDVLTLNVADPAADNGVTRTVLYLSAVTHLPVRREHFVGTLLAKLENFTDVTTNTGLTTADFPW